MRGRPGATSNQVRRGNNYPTYAADGAPQPGAEPNGRPLGKTAGARQRTARTEPHAQRQPRSTTSQPTGARSGGGQQHQGSPNEHDPTPARQATISFTVFQSNRQNRPNEIPFLSLSLSLSSLLLLVNGAPKA